MNESNDRPILTGMTLRQKLAYYWYYYRVHFIVLVLVLIFIISLVRTTVGTKQPELFASLININLTPEAEETLRTAMARGAGTEDGQSVLVNAGWIMTEQNISSDQYYSVQATSVKLMASIKADQLDLVLMDQEAFDKMAEAGLLCDLSSLSGLPQERLVTNTMIVEDNSADVAIDPSVEYHSVTDSFPMGLDLSGTSLEEKAGLNGTIYLGILPSSSRIDQSLACACLLLEGAE